MVIRRLVLGVVVGRFIVVCHRDKGGSLVDFMQAGDKASILSSAGDSVGSLKQDAHLQST